MCVAQVTIVPPLHNNSAVPQVHYTVFLACNCSIYLCLFFRYTNPGSVCPQGSTSPSNCPGGKWSSHPASVDYTCLPCCLPISYLWTNVPALSVTLYQDGTAQQAVAYQFSVHQVFGLVFPRWSVLLLLLHYVGSYCPALSSSPTLCPAGECILYSSNILLLLLMQGASINIVGINIRKRVPFWISRTRELFCRYMALPSHLLTS